MKTAYKLLLLTGLFVLPSASLLAQEPPQEKKTDEKTVVVPFEVLKYRHMAVEVTINGKGPYRVSFHTGSRRTSSTTSWRRKPRNEEGR